MLLTLAIGFALSAQAVDQRTFSSPSAAAEALVAAAKIGDRPALEAIFGPDSHDLLYSGDDVADQRALARFAEWAAEITDVVEHDDGTAEVSVGEEDWPLPIPLVKGDSGWRFDTAAGKEELINRRIGANELSAIDVLRALGDAEEIYAGKDHDGDGVKEYARKILSDVGTQNGLFWNPSKHGGELSPIGPIVAVAVEEGYKRADPNAPKRTPYHGYYFRILTKQGSHAPGGKKDYVVKGNMTGGYALIAHPADYGVSGIMTMVINSKGILFKKDLGADTDKLASAIDTYDPNDSWTVDMD
jgi:hypothetical protein